MPRGKPKETERVLETPEDVVYEALRTTLALRGIDTVSKRADAGLRLIAEVTAAEVTKRVKARGMEP